MIAQQIGKPNLCPGRAEEIGIERDASLQAALRNARVAAVVLLRQLVEDTVSAAAHASSAAA